MSTDVAAGWCYVLSGTDKSFPPNTQHQPAATSVDITRSCSYSDKLLMMGENIARNVELIKVNKSK